MVCLSAYSKYNNYSKVSNFQVVLFLTVKDSIILVRYCSGDFLNTINKLARNFRLAAAPDSLK